MTNIRKIEEKSPNSGSPKQPVDNKVVIKETLANLYKNNFHLILNKYRPCDKQFILDNLQRADLNYVNSFVKEVMKKSEETFDSYSKP